ncbi:MAG: efflux RND transporter periplasmic adaptor subunit [Deltaproteobacteria bacterium]|nr:efflux RND transporter periplasmic adaptor subunit [Deltaproteobacteria bacterium]
MREVRPIRAVLAGVALLLGLLAVGGWPRLERRASLALAAGLTQGPRRVAVVTAQAGPQQSELSLAGSAQPQQLTTLYARSPGFVREVLVDLGDRVKAGQLLAVIEAAELGEDRLRAQARLREAEENVALAKIAADREAKLAAEGASSRQRADEAAARLNSAVAAVDTNRSELRRLETLLAYQRVTAPFAGVIVKRSVDKGALVSGGSGTGVTSLFELADVEVLRIFIDVPQSHSAAVRPGTPAMIFAPGGPKGGVPGEVVRTAGALDPKSRTLRTELKVPSAEGLLAGGYVTVKLKLTRDSSATRVPATALIIGKEGPRVAVVDAQGKVALRPVHIHTDLGKAVDLDEGLAPGERVVISPPDDLADGVVVEAVERDPNAKP